MKRIDVLTKILGEIQDEISTLQKQCPHNDVEAEFGSNSGNLCEVDDLYWINVRCKECYKHMRFDSNEHSNEYRKYAKFVK